MSPGAEEIFLLAHELDPGERPDFVTARCGGDERLRAEVESLLLAAADSQDYFARFSERIGGQLAARPLDVPAHVGPYRVVRLIGRGGMGAVYLAERTDGQFEKQVAVKVLPGASASAEARDRFAVERQILARLVHPHICRLLDGGVTDDGLPFFVMDYVDGERIDRYCDQQRLGLRRRLKLFLQICRAVAFAHRNLVLHRDLKPGNVLVDPNGAVQLLDFGVAKVIEEGQRADGEATRAPLTPTHASPETIRGEAATTASDVYSLGVMLYGLLTGLLPHELEGLPLPKVLERVCREEPPLASRRLEALSRNDSGAEALAGVALARSSTASQLLRSLRDDLDNILARSLRAEPEHRYGSVEALSGDILRHLNGQPVSARPATLGYLAGKFLKRNRLAVSLASVALAALLGVVGLGVKYALDTAEQAEEIAAQRDRAEAVSAFLVGMFEAADPSTPGGSANLSARQVVDQGVARLERDDSLTPETRAELMKTAAGVYDSLSAWDQARDLSLKVLALRSDLFGPRSAEVAEILEDLSTLEDLLGDWDAAERRATQAAAIRQTLGDPIGLAASMTRLGRMQHLRGNLAAARPNYERAYQIYLQEYGEHRRESTEAMGHLAMLSLHEGRLEEAESLQRRALVIRRELFGPDNPALMENLLGLGQILSRMDRNEEARAALEEALALNIQSGGEDEFSNAFVYSALGSVERELGNRERAESHYRSSLRIWALVDEDHPNAAYPSAGLGQLLLERGEPEAGLDYLDQSRRLFEQVLPDSWRLADVDVDRARALMAMERYDEAEALLLAAHARLTELRGSDDQHTRRAAAALVRFYQTTGQPQRARVYATPAP